MGVLVLGGLKLFLQIHNITFRERTLCGLEVQLHLYVLSDLSHASNN